MYISHHAPIYKVSPAPTPRFLAISNHRPLNESQSLAQVTITKCHLFLLQLYRALTHLGRFSTIPQHPYWSIQTLVCPTGLCIVVAR